MSKKIDELIENVARSGRLGSERALFEAKQALRAEIAKMEAVIEAAESSVNYYPDLMYLASTLRAIEETEKENE